MTVTLRRALPGQAERAKGAELDRWSPACASPLSVLLRLRVTAVVLAALITAPTLAAQTSQPWQGRGVAYQQQPAARVNAQAVAMVGLTVSHMDRSIAFYSQVLDFEKVTDDEVAASAYGELQGIVGARTRVVRMRLGEEYLQLTEFLAPRGRPAPVDSRSNDRWFQHVAIIVSDMDQAYARLRRFKVQHSSTGPQLLPKTIPNAAGIRAFYFRDPDGHPLEVLQFPPDKGDPRWHHPNGRLFLGIDHTAIVVSDTKASLGFYRDVLGFRVAGESLNFGTEQERLNNVPGARLRITGLRVATGPGIEFLEYLSPRDGRPFPADERANDLVHWQTTILVPDALAAAAAIRKGAFKLASAEPIALPDTALGFRRGFRLRDPDGHVVQLVER
jgi:catechol 2,3-dioxygenase-like lactoylglutathione lyase family enzyme